LAREAITDPQPFGNWIYLKEELLAELGSTFLMQERGLSSDEIIQDSAAYIQGWLRALKNDKRPVVEASRHRPLPTISLEGAEPLRSFGSFFCFTGLIGVKQE
jgi:hypothetical protein